MAPVAHADSLKSFEQDGERLRDFESGKVSTEAEMRSAPEGLMMSVLAFDIETIRVGVVCGVAVRGGERDGERFAPTDLDAPDLDVFVRDPARVGDGRVVAENLFDRIFHELEGASAKLGEFIRISQQGHDGVADQIAGREIAGQE